MFARNTLIKSLVRGIARPAARVNVAPMMFTGGRMAPFGMMSSPSEQVERASQKLNKALDSEIKYESENYRQLDDIEAFLNESGFMFSETDEGLTMTLTKEVGDKKVEIVFEAR